MSNDDSRGNESSDRRDEQTETATQTIRTHLESIDYLTRRLLEHFHDPATEIQNQRLTDEQRREARRRCREIRAEVGQLGLLCYGPEALIPYRPDWEQGRDADDADGDRSGTTVYSGPDSRTFEYHQRRRDRDADSSSDETDDRERDPDTDDLEHDTHQNTDDHDTTDDHHTDDHDAAEGDDDA
ncbi:hypothetical protein [Natronolimnohabitans innermongolicus]|uniref:Uncharacterized protein n=1 Tax=Natronolimnohabitans innermongolicus JCM 12255 TaxID=1227499 RepID=L9XKF9_9EURY|nr:hypothetical protein [Natronolimnohabitans innermongolicus]ELY61118.1 hypothetical protein C493_03330 [Natronolimnohabitans innermongolicus JCM 12255]